jgi:hypothetical protein
VSRFRGRGLPFHGSRSRRGATSPEHARCTVELRAEREHSHSRLSRDREPAHQRGKRFARERARLGGRQNNPQYGDSARSGHATWIDWTQPTKERAREVMLPYRAYAAAAYTHLGATRGGLLAHGVAGGSWFGLFPQGYKAWKAVNPHEGNPLPTVSTFSGKLTVMEPFAVAPERPVAVVASVETACPHDPECNEAVLPNTPPPDDSVRIVTLEKPARSFIVWRGHLKKQGTLAPAIALAGARGAVAFRVNDELLLARLDADLKPKKPEKLASGDVGAPALLFRKTEPILAWAERASPTDPYRIVIFDGKRHELRAGSESAFAPSIALFDDQLLVAFMQGNAGTNGKIRLARIPLAALRDVVDVSKAADLSPGSVNARDPDLAVSSTGVVVAWSEFPKGTMNRVEVRRLDCKNP